MPPFSTLSGLKKDRRNLTMRTRTKAGWILAIFLGGYYVAAPGVAQMARTASGTLETLAATTDALDSGRVEEAGELFRRIPERIEWSPEVADALARLLESARSRLVEDPEADPARVVLCHARLHYGGSRGPAPTNQRLDVKESGAEDITPTEAADAQKPERIHSVDPQYTEATRKQKVTGSVVIKAVIDKEGCPTNLRVIEGLHPDLDAAALEAHRRSVYRPAEVHGRPINVYWTVTTTFNLD
jgi:TonB family protein